ncbi:hypothetical protein NXS19_004418 [Fusarium pseudograminearum]|nr:hypothetical protein NXS19_004418 [Fusarium pseudograminearum]
MRRQVLHLSHGVFAGTPSQTLPQSMAELHECRSLLCVIEGTFLLKLKGQAEWTELREGQAMLVSARQAFTADLGSEFVRMLIITNGIGIDELICRAGHEYESTTLPETADNRWDTWDEIRFRSACSEVGALLDY